MAKVKRKQTPAKRKEMKKLSMRRAREKLKNDAEKYEREKELDRERKRTTRKKINEVSDREKRKLRKEWKERAKRYRQHKKDLRQAPGSVTTTPEGSDHNDLEHIVEGVNRPSNKIGPSTSRVESGKKRQRRNTDLMRKEIERLREKNEQLQKNVSKYKQKYYREKHINKVTTSKETDKLPSGQRVSDVQTNSSSLRYSDVYTDESCNEGDHNEDAIDIKD